MIIFDYLDLVERFTEDLFGSMSLREASDQVFRAYVPPLDVKLIPCHKDENGEWVPSALEETVVEFPE